MNLQSICLCLENILQGQLDMRLQRISSTLYACKLTGAKYILRLDGDIDVFVFERIGDLQ